MASRGTNMKIAYVTDSGTGKSITELAQDGILSVPLQVTDGNLTYQDMENFSKNDCIRVLQEERIMQTSQPSPGVIEELFQSLKSQGVDLIIAVPICNGLSGTIDTMESLARQLDMRIICVDVYTAMVIQEYLIKRIRRAYEEGKSDLEIKLIVDEVVNSANTILLPVDLKHFVRGGRLTKTAGMLAGLLKIVPMLQINKRTGGRIDTLDKVRTFRRAVDRMVDIMKADPIDETYSITVAHVGDVKTAMEIYHRLQQEFPKTPIQVVEMCNVVAVHSGLGCQGIQYFKQV
jgi:DegV family protein with EDD domain